MLDFSRIEAGKMSAHLEPTDLANFTAELAGNFRAGIENAGLKLKVNCPPLSQTVLIDREMWEKIVFNLLSNAPSNLRSEAKSKSNCAKKENSIKLEVRDTGAGIPAEEMPNIFQRFHRVRTTLGRTNEGTGIGLALVQELVKLHNGKVSVTSQSGKGTTFSIIIPKQERNTEKVSKSLMFCKMFAAVIYSIPKSKIKCFLIRIFRFLLSIRRRKFFWRTTMPICAVIFRELLHENGYEVQAVGDGSREH